MREFNEYHEHKWMKSEMNTNKSQAREKRIDKKFISEQGR